MKALYPLVRADLRKIASARTLLAFPLAGAAYAIASFGPALTLPESAQRAMPADTLLSIARGPGFFVAVTMLLLGALAVTAEFRHGTMATTLAVAPARRRVIAAKLAAVAVVAAVTAAVAEAMAIALGSAFLASNDVASTVPAADLLMTAGGAIVVAVLYGTAGVGLGFVLRDQAAAVGAALTWIGIAEGAVPILLRKPWLFRWLPGGAANAVLGVAEPPPDLLAAWAGGAILLAVMGALVAVGAAAFSSRDVDVVA